MAAYDVVDYSTTSDSIEAVCAAMETKLETITNTKAIYYIDIIEMPDQKKYMGVIIYQT